MASSHALPAAIMIVSAIGPWLCYPLPVVIVGPWVAVKAMDSLMHRQRRLNGVGTKTEANSSSPHHQIGRPS
jgi:hypothetical protein